MTCIECDGPVSNRSKSGRCRFCATRVLGLSRRKPAPHCSVCGRTISRSSRGRCRTCSAAFVNSDPGIKERRAEGIRRKFEEPGHRAKMAKVAVRNSQKYYSNPEVRAKAVERGEWLYKNCLNLPETRARNRLAVIAAGPKQSATKLAWCPPELRDRYRYLQRSKRLSAAAAREIVEREWDELRAARHLLWFEVIDFVQRKTSVVEIRGAGGCKRYRVGLAEMSAGELLRSAEMRGYAERLAA